MATNFTDKSTTTLEDVRIQVGESLDVSNLNQDTTKTGYDQNHQATQVVHQISSTESHVDSDLDDANDPDDVTIVNSY